MKPIKSALALLAATGIALSQPAMAADAARGASPSHDSEQLAGGGIPGAAIPALIAILAVAVVSMVSASNHHDRHHPASP